MGNARVTWTTTFFFFSILVPRSSRTVDRHWRCSSASPLLPSFDRVILHYLSLPISSRFESRGSRTGGDLIFSKIYPLAFLLLILVQWPSFLILAKRERERMTSWKKDIQFLSNSEKLRWKGTKIHTFAICYLIPSIFFETRESFQKWEISITIILN